MIIAIGADKLGFPMKEALKQHLEENNYEILDLGTVDINNDLNYITVADNVAVAVTSGKADRGIVICGSGAGVSIVANKHKGAYCVRVESYWSAKNSREINNANMIALGDSIVGIRMAYDIIDVFLNTEFAPGATPERKARLQAFLDEVAKVEDRYLKG